RFRLNRKFGMNVPESEMTVQKDDVVNSIKYIMRMREGQPEALCPGCKEPFAPETKFCKKCGRNVQEAKSDDIDHLGNRRVRTIDELAGEEVRKGFLRL